MPFEERHGARLEFNFAGSNVLAQQILAAPRADVFLSADLEWIDHLEQSGRVVPGSRRDLFGNRLVVVGRDDCGVHIDTPAELASADYRHLAIAQPDAVPAGRYARTWLESVPVADGELFNALTGRLAPTLDVRAALALVESSQHILGVVYATDVATSDRVRILYAPLPADQPGYPLRRCARRGRAPGCGGRPTCRQSAGPGPLACSFLDFACAEAAQAVYRRHGFLGPMSGDVFDVLERTVRIATVATALVSRRLCCWATRWPAWSSRGKRVLSALTSLPLVLPPTAVGFLLLRILADEGPLGPTSLGVDLGLLLTWKGAVIASAVMSAPLIVRTARVAFEGVDPRLEPLARTLGHSRCRPFCATRCRWRAAVSPVASCSASRARWASSVRPHHRRQHPRQAPRRSPVRSSRRSRGGTTGVGSSSWASPSRPGSLPSCWRSRSRTVAASVLGTRRGHDRALRQLKRAGARSSSSSSCLWTGSRSRPLSPTGGGVTGVFGPSGAGKTSLLEVVAGLAAGRSGSRRLRGRRLVRQRGRAFDLPPERRTVGYVPQESLLFPHLTVRENLRVGMHRVRARARGRVRARGATGDLARGRDRAPGARAALDRPAPTLSGGERRRVALGRALCSGPELLLLDEPLAGLDHGLRSRLLPFLRRVHDEFRLPSLLVSHDPTELVALCDEIVVQEQGKRVAQGPPREVLTDPAVYPLAGHESFQNLPRLRARRDARWNEPGCSCGARVARRCRRRRSRRSARRPRPAGSARARDHPGHRSSARPLGAQRTVSGRPPTAHGRQHRARDRGPPRRAPGAHHRDHRHDHPRLGPGAGQGGLPRLQGDLVSGRRLGDAGLRAPNAGLNGEKAGLGRHTAVGSYLVAG